MTCRIYDSARLFCQPRYTGVGEGDGDDDNDDEYKEDDDQDAKRDGDQDAENGGEDEEEVDEEEDDTSEKLGYMPEPTKWITRSGLPTDTMCVDPPEPTSPATQHFGPALVGCIYRRHKQRSVQLTNRNLAQDPHNPPNESN